MLESSAFSCVFRSLLPLSYSLLLQETLLQLLLVLVTRPDVFKKLNSVSPCSQEVLSLVGLNNCTSCLDSLILVLINQPLLLVNVFLCSLMCSFIQSHNVVKCFGFEKTNHPFQVFTLEQSYHVLKCHILMSSQFLVTAVGIDVVESILPQRL